MIKNHILAGCYELTDTQKAFIGAQQSDWQAPLTGLSMCAGAPAQPARAVDRPCRCDRDRAFLKNAFPIDQGHARRGGG
jgi:hypothetical protein